MKKIILIFMLTFIGNYLFSQTVYNCQYKSDAKKKIFFVDSKYEADLIIYFTDSKYELDGEITKRNTYFIEGCGE